MKKLILFFASCVFLLGCVGDISIPSFNLSPGFSFKIPMTICHMNEDSSFVQMQIYSTELSMHLAHGDYKLDADGDGYTAIGACAGSQDDCDDTRFTVHPNAPERCGDGIDNDCDGKIDEDCWACDIPELHEPDDQAIMDNGCKNRTDPIEWKFEWNTCQDAIKYNLYVESANAQTPFIDTIIEQSEFMYVLKGYYFTDQNILNWKWKVRTFAGGEWVPWSETRTFNIEPINSDCP